MQIKAPDGRANDILALERLLDRPDVPLATRKRIEAEIRQIKAGERAERDAEYQIELYFGQSENWATIHDLRFEVDGLAAQIDHLIVNRLGEVWVCESKAFAEGVSINDHGEWSRWRYGRQEGMASPIEQNRRHIHLLERVFDLGLVPLPRRLGLVPMKPRLRSLVLVANEARISRPRRKVDGLDEVIKAEQLKTRLFDEFDRVSALDISRIIGKGALEHFAQGMAGLHRAAAIDWVARFGLAPMPIPPERARSAPRGSLGDTPLKPSRPWLVKYDGPCATCRQTLPKGTPAVWDNARRKMYCLECAPAS